MENARTVTFTPSETPNKLVAGKKKRKENKEKKNLVLAKA